MGCVFDQKREDKVNFNYFQNLVNRYFTIFDPLFYGTIEKANLFLHLLPRLFQKREIELNELIFGSEDFFTLEGVFFANRILFRNFGFPAIVK